MNTELISVDSSSGFSKVALAGAAASGLAVGIVAHMAYSQRKAKAMQLRVEAEGALASASKALEAALAEAAALDEKLEEESKPAPSPEARGAVEVEAETEAPVDRTLVELIERTDAEIGRLIAITDIESLALVVNFAKNKRAILADPKVTIDQVVQILTETLNAQDAEEGN